MGNELKRWKEQELVENRSDKYTYQHRSRTKIFGTKKMEYTILVHKAQKDVYWAEVPALPGCYSQGETIEKTIDNMKEAIESRLIELKEYEKIPAEEDLVIAKVNITGNAAAQISKRLK